VLAPYPWPEKLQNNSEFGVTKFSRLTSLILETIFIRGGKMGCDIHTVAQIKKEKYWKTVKDNIGGEDRSYNAFAVLANVRNGYGFAGTPTGDEWVPISEPRGFPEDFQVEDEYHEFKNVLGSYSRKWMGDHSHSWVTLEELQQKLRSYAGKAYTTYGVVSRETWDRIQSGEIDFPDEWSGDVLGANIIKTTSEEIKKGKAPPNFTHVRMSWKLPAQYKLGYIQKLVDELWQIKWEYELEKPSEVRLVFGFDS
jgi:hypothetical protein